MVKKRKVTTPVLSRVKSQGLPGRYNRINNYLFQLVSLVLELLTKLPFFLFSCILFAINAE